MILLNIDDKKLEKIQKMNKEEKELYFIRQKNFI